jgi:hypothetical protein
VLPEEDIILLLERPAQLMVVESVVGICVNKVENLANALDVVPRRVGNLREEERNGVNISEEGFEGLGFRVDVAPQKSARERKFGRRAPPMRGVEET